MASLRFLRRDGQTVGAERESTIWLHAIYLLLFIAVLVAAVNAAGGHVVFAASWNSDIYAPAGQTYEQHIAEGNAIIAQVREYSIAHCGESYTASCQGWR